MKLIRFNTTRKINSQYGLLEDDKVYPLKNISSAGEAFTAVSKKKISVGKAVSLSSVTPLPPSGECTHIYCAGLNYRDHAAEVRMPVPKNPIFFSKSAGALCGASDEIVYPHGVRLLDYEVELGVIIGRTIGQNDIITADNIGDYALGICIFNDISARDIQLSAGQWFLGKTYRTFAPAGPLVQTFDRDVMERLYELQLDLQVLAPGGGLYENKKQSGSTADMIFRIHKLLNALRERFDLRPGDIIATGTPRGVALSHPSRLQVRMAEILGIPPAERIRKFIKRELKNNKKYLRTGDVITARIASKDGVVDLGQQRNSVTG